MKFLSRFSDEAEALRAALVLVAYSVAIRIFYAGFVNLMPEEAYYWQYARHLDIGYLDHPPMVALTISLFASIFGTSEFAVRIGAVAWWLIAAFFVFRLSRDIFDRRTGLAAIALFAILPYFFGSGLFMTPDAPLVAFWAASLYFLHAALVKGNHHAWWGAGLCLGLGMLSKYSIALLGISTFVFLIWRKERRKEFFTWRPYIAACSALLLFSPVILWNYEHQWASFAFQSADRLSKPPEFSLHVLLLHILAVLTPVGLFVVFLFVRGWIAGCKGVERGDAKFVMPQGNDEREFLAIFQLVPLLVFALFSLTHEVKINWTGPVFIASLPVIARSLSAVPPVLHGLTRGWAWTSGLLVACYFLVLQYLSFGLPAIPYPSNMYKFMTGSSIAAEVDARAGDIEKRRGQRTVVVGMDKHYLASQMAFYLVRNGSRFGDTAGRNLFGRDSLMYHFWTDPYRYEHADMLLVSKTPADLSDEIVKPFFDSTGAVKELTNYRQGTVVGRFYCRAGLNYRVQQKR